MSFLDLFIHVFHQIWEVSSHNFFKIFFCLFHYLFSILGLSDAYVSMVSHRSLRLCSFFLYSFPFCYTNWIISITFSLNLLILSMFKFYVEVFKISISVIKLFSSRIFICLILYNLYIFIHISYLHLHFSYDFLYFFVCGII